MQKDSECVCGGPLPSLNPKEKPPSVSEGDDSAFCLPSLPGSLHTMAILRQTASQEKLFQTNIQTGRDSLQMETVSVTSVSRVRLSQIGSLSARIHPIVATGLACGC